METGAVPDRHASDMTSLYLASSKRPSRVYRAKLTLHAITVLELLKILIEDLESR